MNTQMSSLQLPRFAICCLIVLAIALPVRGDYPNPGSVISIGGEVTIWQVDTLSENGFNLPGPSTAQTQTLWQDNIQGLQRAVPRFSDSLDKPVTTNKWWSSLGWPDRTNEEKSKAETWWSAKTYEGHRDPVTIMQVPFAISTGHAGELHHNTNAEASDLCIPSVTEDETLQGSIKVFHQSWASTATNNDAFKKDSPIGILDDAGGWRAIDYGDPCCSAPTLDHCVLNGEGTLYSTPCGLWKCRNHQSLVNKTTVDEVLQYLGGPDGDGPCPNARLQHTKPSWISRKSRYGAGQAFLLGLYDPLSDGDDQVYYNEMGTNSAAQSKSEWRTHIQRAYDLWYMSDGGLVSDYHDLGCQYKFSPIEEGDNTSLTFNFTAGTPYIWGKATGKAPCAYLPSVSRYADLDTMNSDGSSKDGTGGATPEYFVWTKDQNGDWAPTEESDWIADNFLIDELAPIWKNLGQSVALVVNGHKHTEPNISDPAQWGEQLVYGFYLDSQSVELGYTWRLEPVLHKTICEEQPHPGDIDRAEYRLRVVNPEDSSNHEINHEVRFTVALLGYAPELGMDPNSNDLVNQTALDEFEAYAFNEIVDVEVTHSVAGSKVTSTFDYEIYNPTGGNRTIVNLLPHHTRPELGEFISSLAAIPDVFYTGINGSDGDATIVPQILSGPWQLTHDLPQGLPIMPALTEGRACNGGGLPSVTGVNLRHLARLMDARYSTDAGVVNLTENESRYRFDLSNQAYVGDFRSFDQWNNLYEYYKYLASLADDLLILQQMREIADATWENDWSAEVDERLSGYAANIRIFLKNEIQSLLTAEPGEIYCGLYAPDAYTQCTSGNINSTQLDQSFVSVVPADFELDGLNTNAFRSPDAVALNNWNNNITLLTSNGAQVDPPGQIARLKMRNANVTGTDECTWLNPAFARADGPQVNSIIFDEILGCAQSSGQTYSCVNGSERLCFRQFDKESVYCFKLPEMDMGFQFYEPGRLQLQILARAKYDGVPTNEDQTANFFVQVWKGAPTAGDAGSLLSAGPYFDENNNLIPQAAAITPWKIGAAETPNGYIPDETEFEAYRDGSVPESNQWSTFNIALFPEYPGDENTYAYSEDQNLWGPQTTDGVSDLYVVLIPMDANPQSPDYGFDLEVAGARLIGQSQSNYYGKFLYYDSAWETLLASPQHAFNMVTQKNDNHYIFGYFLNIFGKVAMHEFWKDGGTQGDGYAWVEDMAPGIELIARDLSNWDYNYQYASFPKSRMFDPFFGHGWAGGSGAGNFGNNEESFSEDINWSNGLILSGEILSHIKNYEGVGIKMRDVGLWQKATIYNASSQWLNYQGTSYGTVPQRESSTGLYGYAPPPEGEGDDPDYVISPRIFSPNDTNQYLNVAQVFGGMSTLQNFFNKWPSASLAIQTMPATASNLLYGLKPDFTSSLMDLYGNGGLLDITNSYFGGSFLGEKPAWEGIGSWAYAPAIIRSMGQVPGLNSDIQNWMSSHAWNGNGFFEFGHDPYNLAIPNAMAGQYVGYQNDSYDPFDWVVGSWYNSPAVNYGLSSRESIGDEKYNWNTVEPFYTGTSYASDYHYVWTLGALFDVNSGGITSGGSPIPISLTVGETTYYANPSKTFLIIDGNTYKPGSTGVPHETGGGAKLDDLLLVLDNWTGNSSSTCGGDFNADEEVDIEDLLMVLSNWE